MLTASGIYSKICLENKFGGADAPLPTQGSFEEGKTGREVWVSTETLEGAISLRTPIGVSFLTTTFNPLFSNWGAILVFAKDCRPFLKSYGFRLIFSFTAITPEHQSAGGKAEVNR